MHVPPLSPLARIPFQKGNGEERQSPAPLSWPYEAPGGSFGHSVDGSP